MLVNKECILCKTPFSVYLSLSRPYAKYCKHSCYIKTITKKIGKKCIICNNNFLVSPVRALAKYCSRKCMGLAYHQKNNKIDRICINCGNIFKVFPHRNNAKFCSRKCRTFRIERKCELCDKIFKVIQSSNKKFCSLSCSTNSQHIKKWKNLDNFTDFQKQIIIGSLLGDGNLSKPKEGENYHLTIAHSEKQLEYLKWKQKLLEPFSSKLNVYRKLDKRFNKVYTTWRFHTKSHPFLTELHKKFYPNGKKVIPLDLMNDIQPITLAVWYFDDGRTDQRYYEIASVCFSKEELTEFCKIISEKFGIKIYPQKSNRTYIASQSYQTFRNLIEPFATLDMRYKL